MNHWKPRKGFYVTPTIVVINLVVFAAFSFVNFSFSDFSPESLYYFGANFTPWVEAGQYWRFITSMFLHFGLMHIAFNCISILFLGKILEPLLGYPLFLAAYFLTGIGGSFASFLFSDGVSAGASGAVFGLFGVFLALLLGNLIRKDLRDIWLKELGTILGLNLLIGLVLNDMIDNAAHLGGLATGFVLGFIFLPFIKARIIRIIRTTEF